ncbi:YhaN family protein [Methylocapsa palsarum]|uniref:Uncharacterized protein YhaN n=1 Tax=Methylocapsa palsarum TaxID=1612308 RepID=A0A1I3WSZ4_9HYPH|nr:YhaN family protein [Methylocapsa palsarum]SFK10635.1 Uncharacterized protein YhaN [Methylocapsa palsarum]
MRFESLVLERYGPFTDRAITFRPDARLHVVYGPNEAGKTSMLAAFADLLFGFPTRKANDFLHDSGALRIGAAVRLADGSALSFRRRRGAKNTILGEDNQALREDILSSILGHVTRETFLTEFGLTADTLRKGGNELLSAGGRLAETLAAASAGVSSLARAGARLQTDSEALFSPRKVASKEFYIADVRYQDAQRRMREAIVTADALKDAARTIKDAQDNFENIKLHHEEIGRGLALRRRAQRTRSKLLRIDIARAQLKTFEDLPLVGADKVKAWRSAHRELAEIDKALADLDFADTRGAAAIAALAVDETLLAMAPDIDALRERISAIRKAEDDLPRRREAQRAAREALDEAARRLDLSSHRELLALQPGDPALARVRELADALRRGEERLEEANTQAFEAGRELERLEAGAEPGVILIDPGPLRRRLELFVEIPADAETLRRNRAASEALARRLAEDAAALDPQPGNVDGLARLPLPQRAEIEAAAREAEELARIKGGLDAGLEAANRKRAEIENEIARLARSGAIATREDVALARARRDEALRTLEHSLDAGGDVARPLLNLLDKAIKTADGSADLLLSDTERATLLEAANHHLREASAECERINRDQEIAARRRDEAGAAWRGLWAKCGLAPKSPALMTRWRERAADLLDHRRRFEEQSVETEALSVKLASRREALAPLLADLGLDPLSDLPVELLHREACAAIERIQSVWTGHREREVARLKAITDRDRAQAVLADRELALRRLRADWPKAAAAIGLATGATPREAEAALAVWRDVPVHRGSFERESRSVEGIERDLQGFAQEVTALAGRAGSALAGGSPPHTLAELTRGLAATRAAGHERDALGKAAAERALQRRDYNERRERLGAVVRDARRQSRLPDEADIAPALARLDERAALDIQLSDHNRDLSESSDGQNEAALRCEQEGVDWDALAAEIERFEMMDRQLIADMNEAATRLHDAKRTYETLALGRDAEGAARERAEAGAALVAIAERWLVKAAAARLAARAIELHRSSVEEPLVTRASHLFNVATNSAFKGLAASYDEADQPVLVGIRMNSETVPVAGMSEGARDQLFLSLRLALLELRSAEPLPFIGDDLLSSFDEDRVAATADLLSDFGRSRQTILFTHHRHVADIAGKRLGAAADVITL